MFNRFLSPSAVSFHAKSTISIKSKPRTAVTSEAKTTEQKKMEKPLIISVIVFAFPLFLLLNPMNNMKISQSVIVCVSDLAFTFAAEKAYHEQLSVAEITNSAFEPASMMAKCKREGLLLQWNGKPGLLVIVYFMAGLTLTPQSFFLTALIVSLCIITAQGLGLAIGAAMINLNKATTLASETVMAFLLASGFFVKNVPIFSVTFL